MGMAKPEPIETDYPYQGLAERVHVSKPSGQWNRGLSFVWPVCEICGALLADQERHDKFHAALADDRE
jgi:hypothetical protein